MCKNSDNKLWQVWISEVIENLLLFQLHYWLCYSFPLHKDYYLYFMFRLHLQYLEKYTDQELSFDSHSFAIHSQRNL